MLHAYDERFLFCWFNIVIFYSFIYFCLLKICGEFEFTECLEIFLFKIKENT